MTRGEIKKYQIQLKINCKKIPAGYIMLYAEPVKKFSRKDLSDENI